MTIDEAIDKLETLITSLDTELMNISEKVALTTKNLIVNRIQQKGIGKQYSKNKIPAYLLLLDEDRLDTSAAVNFVKQKAEEGDGLVSWEEVRQAHGNQTAFVDLTYTGRMFMNLGIIATEKKGDKYITIIGGFDEEVRKKLEWNTIRFGEFMITIPEEDKVLAEMLNNRLRDLENNYLK